MSLQHLLKTENSQCQFLLLSQRTSCCKTPSLYTTGRAPKTLIGRTCKGVGGTVASWLVQTPDPVVRVWVLAGEIVLCSWARHYSHGASLHSGV